MSPAAAGRWNDRYRAVPPRAAGPAEVVADNAHLLPATGSALELACGNGGNALFLARRGLRVTARDISSVALDNLRRQALVEGLSLTVEVANIEQLPWPGERYDVVVVSRYLHRPLAPHLIASLNPGGLLFYQTFTAAKPARVGPSNPDYLLRDNELLDLFHALKLRFYREDAHCGNPADGRRNEAYFVGQKAGSTFEGVVNP